MKSKQLSGYQKLKRRKLLEQQRKADFGALHKFFVTQPVDDAHIKENIDDHVEENIDDHVEENIDDHVEEQEDVEVEQAEEQEPIEELVDIYDPRMWDKLNSEEIKLLVEKCPKRDTSIEYGPYDTHGRRFAASLYTRILPNLEKCDREWLVYSKELDKVFCFCCKLFKKGNAKGNLDDKSYGDWHHVAHRLKDHEKSLVHLTNRNKWFEIRKRLKMNETIDKIQHDQFKKERDYWKYVLLKIIAIVKFLAKHNLAFCGKKHKLYQKATSSLETRFQQFKDKNLKSSCHRLEKALRFEIRSDIDAEELYMELKLFETLETSELSNPIDVLKFMKELDYFPNACIAYRILLTIPVTVTSAELGFSKLKFLKSYLRSTMTQERLSGLAMISIENEMLESINYEELINQFAIKNTRRASRIIDYHEDYR
ncbi:hypothetical protein LXL04_015339 [Taraxacum kok-saghyz]